LLKINKEVVQSLILFLENEMTFPSNRHLDDALVLFIDFCGGTIESHQSYEPLATYFSLTQVDLAEKTPDGQHERWSNAIQWSRQRSVDGGYILKPDSLARGYWRLSEKGFQRAEKIITSLGSHAVARLGAVAKPIRDSWTRPFEL
jgi:restriction endonuclease Mrr